ncbi:MAG: YMGG-like glycine zipper-containing protein [Bdellovibrio bacteriovorus]
MPNLTLPIALAAVLTLSGCAGMSDTQRRTTTGAGAGAATGALIGSFSANAGKGALIGAGVGALGGYLYDQNQKSQGR